MPRKLLAERFPFDDGHRVVRRAGALSRTNDWKNVRMLKRRREQDLTLEPIDVDIGVHLRRQQFYDDRHPNAVSSAK